MYGTEPRLVGGRYEIGAVLGYGGMAEVYHGRDVRLGREVAVKTLRADLARDPTFHARFRREAQSSAALNHPSIVSVYDTGEDMVNGVEVPYIVMEYVEGRTLRDVIANEGRLTEQRAFEITSDVCAALDYSHRMGIIHRDIKPANVMLTPNGQIKVMDFGIARATTSTSSTMTGTAQVIGTAQYLSPEQARGETVDIRSDVYSTGVLLYELLTGVPPFRGDNPVAVAYQHVKEMPQPPSVHDPSLSPQADAIVFKAMAKAREDRYQTAGEMRDDLERALAGRHVLAPLLGAAGAAGATRMISRDGYGDATTAYDPYGRGAGYGRGYETGQYGATNQYGAAGPYADTGYDDDRYDDGRYGPGGTGQFDRAGGPPDDGAGGRRDWWKWALAALAVLIVFGIAALVGSSLLSGGGGGGTVTIPADLVKSNGTLAEQRLSNLGLSVNPVQQASKTIDSGLVISVSPAGGSVVKKHAAVTLTISSGPQKVQVPPLTNMTYAQAKAQLDKLGLTAFQSTVPPTAGQTPGQVTAQNPAAGTQVDAGSQVTLTVVGDQGTIPSVVNQTFNQAASALRAAGYTNISSKYQSSTQPTGTVLGQDPAPGAAPLNTQITLTLAQQVAQTPTPTPTTNSPSPSPTPTSTGILPGT